MPEKILFVDDDEHVLASFQRQLRRQYDVLVGLGGRAGLEILEAEPDVAVIVSDMRMPGMNGADFLARAKRIRPDAVQMILSGQAELSSTIEAVNEGNLYRFLTKPCETHVLVACLRAGVEQYRLITAERDLLQRTLAGSVGLLTDVLSLVNPVAFSRSARIERYAMGVAERLGLADQWQLRLAALLSQLGCVTLPPDTVGKILAGSRVSDEEKSLFASHPLAAAKLVARIPRLEGVARIIAAQADEADSDVGAPDESEQQAALILRAAAEFDLRLIQGMDARQALEAVARSAPPRIAQALSADARHVGQPMSRGVTVAQLRAGMVLEDDVKSRRGVLLMSRGQTISEAALVLLARRDATEGIDQPIRVQVPAEADDSGDAAEEAVSPSRSVAAAVPAR